ncbi:hypothetical protein HanRHA438_Chr09g0415781 [Helianthus annuus]|nr:hypothetical protein HanRHA438_Chr09g0415781 [Helianthus annuus]
MAASALAFPNLHCKYLLCSNLNSCASVIALSPTFLLLVSAAKLRIECVLPKLLLDPAALRGLVGLDIPLDGDGADPNTLLHGEAGRTAPLIGEGDNPRGVRAGPSFRYLFAESGLLFRDSGGETGSGSTLLRRLTVSCLNLAGTVMPRGVAPRTIPGVLPEETLSASEFTRSALSNSLKSLSILLLTSRTSGLLPFNLLSPIIDFCNALTAVAVPDPLKFTFSFVKSTLLVIKPPCRDLAVAGHRF